MIIFLISSCRPAVLEAPHSCEPSPNVKLVTTDLDLSCYEGTAEYSSIGKVGTDEFCFLDGIGDFQSISNLGSRFITAEPTANLSGQGISGTQRFFTIYLEPDIDNDTPEGYVKFYFGFSGEEDLEKDFFDLLKVGEIPFAGENQNILGFSVSLNFKIPKSSNFESDKLIRFSSLDGSQSDSFCRIKAMTSRWMDDHYEGELEFEYKAGLYYSGSSGCEGLWKTIEGEAKLPWNLYL